MDTTWDLEKMEKMLRDYEDKEVIKFLKYSFPINAKNTLELGEIQANQKGAKLNFKAVRRHLREEVKQRSIIGPCDHNPFGSIARFSPFDTREKRDSREPQVILNLSYPYRGPR